MDEKVVAIQLDPAQETDLVRALPRAHDADVPVRRRQGHGARPHHGRARLEGAADRGDEILKGGDQLERLQKRRKGREADPDLRLRYADILADRAQLEDALSEYLAVHALGGAAGRPRSRRSCGWAHLPQGDGRDRRAGLDARAARAEGRGDRRGVRALAGPVQGGHARRATRVAYDAMAHVEGPQAERAGVLRARLARSCATSSTPTSATPTSRQVTDVRAAFQAGKAARAAEVAAAPGQENVARRSLQTLREDTSRDYEVLVGLRRLGEATLWPTR
jgi:hypothetical protein